MYQRSVFILLPVLMMLLPACSSHNYIYNRESSVRQKEMQQMRSESVLGEFMNVSLVVLSAALETGDMIYEPGEQQFKKLSLVNPTNDTVYVNMLADVLWDSTSYCDFMDIRIPPKENCKLLVPVDTEYNLYFSHTIRNDDDEWLQIDTDKTRKINLVPGNETGHTSLKE
jgi:hypothetical protein